MDVARLRDIVARLERHRQAATYGAVGGVVEVNPRRVMATEDKSTRNSWVVNARTRRPTGYRIEEMDPELFTAVADRGVIDTPEALRAWLETHDRG